MENKTVRIVVFGGSFNPPTLAHRKLLCAAMEGIGADRGYFVPSNNDYVTKKMKKTDWPSEVISENTRSAMLKAMCADDARLGVEEGEYLYPGTAGNSIDTMRRIQAKSPDGTELYFLFGGDKLKVFTKWKTFREFCENFRIIVFSRDGFDPEHEIEHTKALKEFRDSFVILPSPAGIEGISSTAVRDAVRGGDAETARSMLDPAVFELLRGTPVRQETAITSFRGRYAFLSNFYAVDIPFEGLTYPSCEAAFQAAKCLDPEERIPFTETTNPVAAKRMGKKVRLRGDWEAVKVGIMEQIVRIKFTLHPELAEKLVATGSLPIMEANNWHDTFWGVDAATGRGENHLGEILMKVRAECGGTGPVALPSAAARVPAPVPAPAQAEKKPAEPEPETVYEAGMTIRHPRFGDGTVEKVSGQGKSRILDVQFPDAGLKRLGMEWVEKNCAVS